MDDVQSVGGGEQEVQADQVQGAGDGSLGDQWVEATAEVLAHLGDFNVVPEAIHPPLNVQETVPSVGALLGAPIVASQPILAAPVADPQALLVVASSPALVFVSLNRGNEVIPFLHLSALPSFSFRGSFYNLSVFEINLDTLVPTFIHDDDDLLFLASISMEQNDRGVAPLIGSVLPPTGLPLVPYEDSDDEEVLEVHGLIPPSSRKHRSRLRESLWRLPFFAKVGG
jgi:hypothetical protein